MGKAVNVDGKRMEKICLVAGIECDIIMSSEVLPVEIQKVC